MVLGIRKNSAGTRLTAYVFEKTSENEKRGTSGRLAII
jgi:hypothetical protein